MKRTYAIVACIAAVAALAGCGRTTHGVATKPVDCTNPSLSQSQWIDHCATGQLSSTTTPPAVDYNSPADMLAKLHAGGFTCEPNSGDVPTYDAVNALRLTCWHGTADEQVQLMTFETQQSEDAERQASQTVIGFWAEGWAIAAQSRKTLGEATAILMS